MVLLLNALLLDNKIANGLSPELRTHHVIDVEPIARQLPLGCFIHEDFSLCVVDEPEDNFEQFVKQLNEKASTPKTFDKQSFSEICRRNIQAAE
jgi:hypothetical protein